MRIDSDLKFRPFSHVPGTGALIPGSCWALYAYPTRLVLKNLISGKEKSLDLSLTGPVKRFTLLQDLERRALLVFGTAEEGYFRLMLTHKEKKICILAKRIPAGGLEIGGERLKLKEMKQISVAEHNYLPPYVEHLSLGCHKAQDVDLMRRRLDLSEVLPLWFRIGQLTPPTLSAQKEGTLTLLPSIAQELEERDKMHVAKPFLELYLSGLSDIFVPRLIDEQFQGVAPKINAASSDLSPLALLSEGAQLIRLLFFHQKGNDISLLPCLPPELHAGRLINIHAGDVFTCDIEWSKKTLRRVVIRPLKNETVNLKLQRSIKTYRVRTSCRGKGEKVASNKPLSIKRGTPLFLDHFEA